MWQVEAITNIIKNCIKNSLENSEINIFYEQTDISSNIIIKAFGYWIDKKDISHIFQRFGNLDNPSFASLGIVFDLSKKIIEKNNGIVEVESDKTGTVFTIKYFCL